MNIPWQDIIAGGLAAAAAGYLARRGWLIVRSKRAGGCGTCSTCPATGGEDARPLVGVESLRKSVPRDSDAST